MSNSGDWGLGPCASIGVLTTVEAIRKRPGMFFNPVGENPSNDWREDALLPAKLIRQCLVFAVGATEAHITVGHQGDATVSFDVATDPRLFESTPGPGPPLVFEDVLVGDLAAVNAMSAVFQATINTDEGEWGQRFEKGVEVDPWRRVGDVKGQATFLEIQLDAEILPTVDFDPRYLTAATSNLPFPVTLVF